MTNNLPGRPTASRARVQLAKGRPSGFSWGCAERICKSIAEGRPLTEIVRQDGMPEITSVYRWLAANPEFKAMYAQAREDMAHTLVAQTIEIADDSSDDWIERDGERVVNHEAVQRSRLRVDTRKWAAARLLPKVYGDRVMNELTGAEGGPVQIDHHRGIGPSLKAAAAALDAVLARQDEPRLPEREPIRHFGQQEN